MSKIRINELARELEVKPNVILETLAELGIADKKTHSSSLDDDVALQVRNRVTGEAGGGSAPAAREVSHHQEARPRRLRRSTLLMHRTFRMHSTFSMQRDQSGRLRLPHHPHLGKLAKKFRK